MWLYIVKIVVSTAIIVAVSELAKRNSFWAAGLASLPLTSLLTFVWVYLDTGDTERIGLLSHNIFWLVLPSLILFIALPLLLRTGIGFWIGLAGACIITAIAYLGMVKMLGFLGVRL